MNRLIIFILTIIFPFLLFTGCKEVGPILSLIESEVKVENISGLDENITINSVDKIVYSGTEYYIASGRKIWYRPADVDSEWSKLGSPADYSSIEAGSISMAIFNDGGGDKIYCTFYSNPGYGSTALYQLDFDPNDSTPDWTLLYTADQYPDSGRTSIDFTRYYLFKVDTDLFIDVVTYHKDSFKQVTIKGSVLHHIAANNTVDLSSTAVSFSGCDNSERAKVERIIFDDDENDYWLIYNTKIDNDYQGVLARSTDGGSSFSRYNFPSDITHGIGYNYMGLYFTNYGDSDPDTDILIVSTFNESTYNYLYYSEDHGNTWTTIRNKNQFSCFADISSISIIDADHTVLNTDGIILMGTRSNSTYYAIGYLELYDKYNSDTGTYSKAIRSNKFSQENNYTSTGENLSEASIYNFFVDGDNDIVYCMTYNSGLWLNYLVYNQDNIPIYREWLP